MTTKGDAVDPGQAGKPDLDVWRSEAGEAARLTVHIPKAPWRYGFSDGAFAFRDVVGDAKGRGFVRGESSAEWPAIGAFIAAARTGWPRDAARVGVLVDMLARARAVLDALPHCLGTWVKGSGGHCVYANDCRKIATVYEDGADGYNFCDEHGARNILDKFREEYLWADAVRALDAASAKEPNR